MLQKKGRGKMDDPKTDSDDSEVHTWLVQAIIDMQNIEFQREYQGSEELDEPKRKNQAKLFLKPPASYTRRLKSA
jgi:hypothetical protein